MKYWMLAAVALLGGAVQAATPEWIAAKVVRVDAERSNVTLDHAPIRSIGMDAMVMPFKVDKRVDLKRFKRGDKVRFTVSDKDDHLVIEAMEKAK